MKATFRQISKHITDELETANESICIAVAWFTNETLFDILLDKIRKGITVELIVNNDGINNREDGLDFNEFIKLGGKFYFADTSRLMHHKFVIIDNCKLISGSYNWTYNAEFRNIENVLSTDINETIEQFKKEFSFLISDGQIQTDIVTIKPVTVSDYDVKEYLKDDYFFKSFAEEREGNLKKSLKAIETAHQLDTTDTKITERVKEVQKKIEKPEYHYHIEDGQFSFDFTKSYLLGKEGDIVRTSTDRTDDEDEIYILFIDGFYVECIGNIDRNFPKNIEEHNEVKRQTMQFYGE